MQQIPSTRAALMERKQQIELAKQGRELLEQKRAALMQELLRVSEEIMQEADALQEASDNARQALARAEAVAGTEMVRSAAFAARAELTLSITTTSVMGVTVPEIEQRRISRPLFGRGYSITNTSITIDETAAAFERVVEMIIQLAESELRLRRLADEIQSTSRRLNALDHQVIPQLEREQRYIQMMLDERERSDHFRLKLVKQLLSDRQ